MNKLLSSALVLVYSVAGMGLLTDPAQAGCNAFGCSQSSVADCNAFGCPNAPEGEECTPFGCPASPQPKPQSDNNNSNNSANPTRSDFQFCVEQYKEEGSSTAYAIRQCEDLR